MRIERIALAILLVLLPGLLLAPAWRLSGLGANEDDILYYLPSRVFFHETIAAGHWPWLNPWNGLDRPYAADPQSALWYPFTWLFAVLPPLWAYPTCLWMHYSLAMWGMYRLLRARQLDHRAAVFGSLAFAFSGFMLAHRAHFTMQHAAAWTPWVIWRLERFVYAPAGPGPRSASVGAARLLSAVLVTTLQCLAGHVQIAAITALGSIFYLLARRRQPVRTIVPGPIGVFGRCVLVWTCVVGVFAIQWLPTLAYLRLCTRMEHTYRDFTENSWNPVSAIVWLLPMLLGQRTPNAFDQPYWGPSHQCEQFAYTGIATLFLAAVGLRGGWRADPQRRPWVALLAFSLLLALGKFGPVCPLLYWIPGSSLFRVPARALVLFNLAVAALAAATLHELGTTPTPRRARLRATVQRWTQRPFLLALAVVFAPLVLVAATAPFLPHDARRAAFTALRPWNLAIAQALAAAIATLSILAFVVRRWRHPSLLWLVVLVLAADLGVIGWAIDVPRGVSSADDLLADRDGHWLEPLRESGERLWVVTDTAGIYREPVRKRAANTNALVHVHALTDYGPLHPLAYRRRFGFSPWGVTERAADLLQNTDWMRPFNVGWILVCTPSLPDPAGCDRSEPAPQDWRCFRNPSAPGMAFFEDPSQPGAVVYAERSPSSFVTAVDTWPAGADARPGARVVISRLALPGWQATVNQHPCPIERAEDMLLAARVPRGQAAQIEWRYFPPGLVEGAAISALSVVVLVGLFIRTQRGNSGRPVRRRSSPRA